MLSRLLPRKSSTRQEQTKQWLQEVDNSTQQSSSFDNNDYATQTPTVEPNQTQRNAPSVGATSRSLKSRLSRSVPLNPNWLQSFTSKPATAPTSSLAQTTSSPSSNSFQEPSYLNPPPSAPRHRLYSPPWPLLDSSDERPAYVAGEAAFNRRRSIYNQNSPAETSISPPATEYFLCETCDREKNLNSLACEVSNLDGFILGVCRFCIGPAGGGLDATMLKTPSPNRPPVPPPFGATFMDRNSSFRTDYNPPAGVPYQPPASEWWWRSPPSPVRQTHTCVICTEDYPHDDFLLPTSSCAHEADYCRRCMQLTIKTDLDSKGWDKLVCPETRCKQRLSDADVLRHAPGNVYAR